MPIIIIIFLMIVCIFIAWVIPEFASSTKFKLIPLGICLLLGIWWFIAAQMDFNKYENTRHEVLEDSGAQYIIYKEKFININKICGQYVKPGQVVEVIEPTNMRAGGIYWMGIYWMGNNYTVYKIIDKNGIYIYDKK